MSVTDPSPPVFTHPHDGSAGDTPKIYPDPPSPQQARMIRLVSAVIAAGLVILAVVGLLTGHPEWLIVAILAGLVLAFGDNQLLPSQISKTYTYALRYAWIGERARRPRFVSQKEEERLAAHRLAAQEAKVAQQAARTRTDAVPNWVRAGLPTEGTPRDDLQLPAAAERPTSVELTTRELDAIVRATGGVSLMPHSRCEVPASERAAQTQRLINRGVLRKVADEIELAPEWLPLLGVARYAERAVSVSWAEGREVRWFVALSVPGHVVRASPPSTDTEAPPPPESRHRLDATTAERFADEVVAAHGVVERDKPNGVENFLAISTMSVATCDDRRGSWTAKALPGGVFAVQDSFIEPPEVRRLDEPSFRAWLLSLSSAAR